MPFYPATSNLKNLVYGKHHSKNKQQSRQDARNILTSFPQHHPPFVIRRTALMSVLGDGETLGWVHSSIAPIFRHSQYRGSSKKTCAQVLNCSSDNCVSAKDC